MDREMVKGKPLSKEETMALLELIESSKIITSKTTNATNNKLKNEEWIRIAQTINASATNCRRKPQQLRLKWENLKKNARKRSTKIRMNNIQTGGGPGDYIPPDEILERVTSLQGSTASGFEVPYGGDREEVFGDGCDDGEGYGGGDGVNSEISDKENNILLPSTSSNILTVPGSIIEVMEQDIPNVKPRSLSFNTPRSGKLKKQVDGSKAAKDIAMAEYLKMKKKCEEAKLEYILLSNEKLKLENEKLRLELESMRK